MSGKELERALELAGSRGRVVLVDRESRRWLATAVLETLAQRALGRLEVFHHELAHRSGWRRLRWSTAESAIADILPPRGQHEGVNLQRRSDRSDQQTWLRKWSKNPCQVQRNVMWRSHRAPEPSGFDHDRQLRLPRARALLDGQAHESQSTRPVGEIPGLTWSADQRRRAFDLHAEW